MALSGGSQQVSRVEALLEERLNATLVEIEREDDGMVVVYRVSGARRYWTDLVSRISALEGVRSVKRS